MKKILLLSSILFLANIGRMIAQIGINYIPQPGEAKSSPLVIKQNTDSDPVRRNQLRFNTGETIVPYSIIKSKANGEIEWGNIPGIIKPINGVYPLTGFDYISTGGIGRHALQTNAYIDLPPGKWAVNLNFKLNVAKSRTEKSRRIETITTIIPARTITVTYTSTTQVTQQNSTASSTVYITNVTEAINNNLGTTTYQAGDIAVRQSSCRGSRCYYRITRTITIPPTTQTTNIDIVDYNYVPLLRSEGIWAKITLSENLISTSNSDYNLDRTRDTNVDGKDLFLISSAIVGPATFSTFNGELYIHNRSTQTKRYYVKLNLEPQNVTSSFVVSNFALGPQDNYNDRFFAISAE